MDLGGILMGKKCFKVGEKAQDFTLFDHNDKKFKLSDFKGERVLLSFHPLAWTSVCGMWLKLCLLKESSDTAKSRAIPAIDSLPISC